MRTSCLPVWPNVRVKPPAEAGSVSLVCEGAEGAAQQAYAACRSGVGLNEGLGINVDCCCGSFEIPEPTDEALAGYSRRVCWL
jgi:hypothetical protein